jgi:hypothetical protein
MGTNRFVNKQLVAAKRPAWLLSRLTSHVIVDTRLLCDAQMLVLLLLLA